MKTDRNSNNTHDNDNDNNNYHDRTNDNDNDDDDDDVDDDDVDDDNDDDDDLKLWKPTVGFDSANAANALSSNPIAVRECVMSFVKCYDLVTV